MCVCGTVCVRVCVCDGVACCPVWAVSDPPCDVRTCAWVASGSSQVFSPSPLQPSPHIPTHHLALQVALWTQLVPLVDLWADRAHRCCDQVLRSAYGGTSNSDISRPHPSRKGAALLFFCRNPFSFFWLLSLPWLLRFLLPAPSLPRRGHESRERQRS